MRQQSSVLRFCYITALVAFSLPARATLTIPSDGSDGAFNPTVNTTINLGNAINGSWDSSNTANAGKGVYDASKWAVVYKYSSVNIPSGVTVTFTNHPKGAPVVWLVQGNVTIAGTIDLSAAAPSNTGTATPGGPGGFRGGVGGGTGIAPSSGFGPGAIGSSASGSYATVGSSSSTEAVYGIPDIVPLIGGSGGAGGTPLKDGSGGGGAILIATPGTLTLNGTITSTSPNSSHGGSGGAIRLVCESLTGIGNLSAVGGGYGGGSGRIRIEANSAGLGGTITPTPSTVVPIGTNTPVIWPAATAPALVVTQVGGINVPADPYARLELGSQDISLSSTSPVVVRLQATNVPTDWIVKVRMIPKSGTETVVAATRVSGDAASSVWEASLTLPHGIVAIEARAHKP